MDSASFRTESFTKEISRLWENARNLSRTFDYNPTERDPDPFPMHCGGSRKSLLRRQVVQGIRMEDCLESVRKYEQVCGHTFTWIYKDRPDLMHDKHLFKGNRLEDMAQNKVHASCNIEPWGTCDLHLLIPRKWADTVLSTGNKYTCISKHTPATCRATYPECLLMRNIQHTHLYRNGSNKPAPSLEQVLLPRIVNSHFHLKTCQEKYPNLPSTEVRHEYSVKCVVVESHVDDSV